mmetsp:Transcript_119728/g.335298  ORF Transcript_119728/g.335298 Transcript_119728/m.335298 type:complete len:250 (+) Transcript_119728:768-1517(+)
MLKSGAGVGQSGLVGEVGSQPGVKDESSVGAARNMFCLARFKRFIISSALSFLSGSVSLSGWNFSDFARQAFVISFTVAVEATPSITWSDSSQMVLTRAGKVLKPFCLLSITWFSLNTRTHATYTWLHSKSPIRCTDSLLRTGPRCTSVPAELDGSLVPEAYTVNSKRSPVRALMRTTTAVSRISITSISGSLSSCVVFAWSSKVSTVTVAMNRATSEPAAGGANASPGRPAPVSISPCRGPLLQGDPS